MDNEFTQTSAMTDVIEKWFSDDGYVVLEIEKVRGGNIKLYCTYKGMRLLEMGPLPLKRMGDIVQVEQLRIKLDRP